MRTFVPGCRQSSWLAAPLHDAPDRLGLGSWAIERAVKSFGVVFFRSGGDGGAGRGDCRRRRCCRCGACRSGGAVRPGRGGVVRLTATPRCSGRAGPIRGRAESLSGKTRGDVGAAPGLAAQGARWGCCGRILARCSRGRAAKAVRSGWASISIRAILKGKASLKVSMTCWYWAITACLLVGAKMVETSAPAGSGAGRAQPGW